MSPEQAILSRLPNADEALRSLADVLRMPRTCRSRACRRERRCQGGYGPPCYFEKRVVFAESLRDHMEAHRLYWDEQRAGIEATLRR